MAEDRFLAAYGPGGLSGRRHGTTQNSHRYRSEGLFSTDSVTTGNSNSSKYGPTAELDLTLYGRPMRIFKDDQLASVLHTEAHMQPWRGDQAILVDRFDGRNLLDDKRLFMRKKFRERLKISCEEEQLEVRYQASWILDN